MKSPKLHIGVERRRNGGNVQCKRCNLFVHLDSDTLLEDWVETGKGNFCFRCFFDEYRGRQGSREEWALRG